ncbi:MAG: hypothetical protein AB1515_10530 [Nitrospirota bacterium]
MKTHSSIMLSIALSLTMTLSGWAANPAAPESAEDEAKERLERMAPPGGVREGTIAEHPVEILVNGVKKGAFTGADLQQLPATAAFSPRGKRTSWTVLEVLKKYNITSAKSLNFYNQKNRKISLPWEDLTRQKEKVNFSYNYKGELILSTDVADRLPEEVRSTDPRDAETEDQRREEMHKQRKQSLIFFRDVRRVEVVQ